MSFEDGEHAAHDSQPDRRKAVKGFAEFCCSPVANKDKEFSKNCKVSNTRLQYTYPVRMKILLDVPKTFATHILDVKICPIK